MEIKRFWGGGNDLGTTHPSLAKEFHPIKNGELTVQQLVAGSNKKVWWQCENGHEWCAAINSRANGCGCPECQKGRKISFPEKAALYYLKKVFPDAIANANQQYLPWLGEMELDIYIPSLTLAVEYDGPWHTEKKDQRKNTACKDNGVTLVRIRDKGVRHTLVDSINFRCADKSDRALGSALEEVFEFLAERYGFSTKVDINIERDSLEILELLDPQVKERTLKATYPEVADEWNYEKNGYLKSEKFTFGSNKKVWWKCGVCGHEWKTKICHRTTSGSGCPLCCKKGRAAKDLEEQK